MDTHPMIRRVATYKSGTLEELDKWWEVVYNDRVEGPFATYDEAEQYIHDRHQTRLHAAQPKAACDTPS